MKLGVAFLYGEGGESKQSHAGSAAGVSALAHPIPVLSLASPLLSLFPSSAVVANVDKAASALSYVEAMSGVTKPFVWLLFRPPWSSEICSKACIFKRLLEMADEDPIDDPLLPTATPRARQLHRARLLYSAGKTMALAVRQ